MSSGGPLPDDDDFQHVATGVAVLAAIAAGDALCCALLGERARGQDHRQTVDLLATVRLGDGSPAEQAREAKALAAALATALDVKDEAHYGTRLLGPAQVRRTVRAATLLVTAAGRALGASPA